MNPDNTTEEKLLSEFPETSMEEWRAAAEALLKGKPFDKVMIGKTLEGISLQPIFSKDILEGTPLAKSMPGFDGFIRGTKPEGYKEQAWEIAQELPEGEPHKFNAAIKADLMRGQNALNIVFDIATIWGEDPDKSMVGHVGACGLSIANLEDLRVAFEDIIPDAVSFHLRSGCSGLPLGALWFAWLKEQGVHNSLVKGSIGMDPVAVWAASGKLPASLQHMLDELAILAKYTHENTPQVRSIGVSSMPYHQAGASAVEELAAALATGSYYLDAMIEQGMDVNAAANQLRFSLSVGPNFFMEIAKFRAARYLWAQVVKAYGGSEEAQKMVVHARTGLYNKTVRDPYVNMLRTTSEALSAVIGGVDSLCVGNFDETYQVPNEFSRRISRNTQVILQEECELTNVVDPAGGSWAIEWLTDQLMDKAWESFQDIEAKGGIIESLKTGYLAELLEKTSGAGSKLLNTRRSSLVGTNVYPNLNEKLEADNYPDYMAIFKNRSREVEQTRTSLDEEQDAAIVQALEALATSESGDCMEKVIDAFKKGATLGEVCSVMRAKTTPEQEIAPLPTKRLADDYEKLREASEKFETDTGYRPAIFLCNLGPLRRHKIRADFTKSFFETGGFEILYPKGFETPEDAANAYLESGSQIVVVCGTDDDYAEKFADYCAAIKGADANAQVILAGFPGDNEEAFRAAGMDDYIFIKSNNYEVNAHYLKGLGVIQ